MRPAFGAGSAFPPASRGPGLACEQGVNGGKQLSVLEVPMLPSPCGVTGSAVPPSGACSRSAVLQGPPGRGPGGSLEGLATWLAPLKHRSGCTALGKRSRGAFADVPPSKPCCAPTWPGTRGASAGVGTVLPQQTGLISIRRMRSPCTPPWQASWPQELRPCGSWAGGVPGVHLGPPRPCVLWLPQLLTSSRGSGYSAAGLGLRREAASIRLCRAGDSGLGRWGSLWAGTDLGSLPQVELGDGH